MVSSLQHQEKCLQLIHKTIRQFQQHLKAEQLDRWTLQFFVLQLQIDFALLRFLLFSLFGTTPTRDTSVNNSAISPPTTISPNPNPNPTSNELPIPCADERSIRRSTRRALWDHPERKQTILQTPNYSLQTTHGMTL